MQEDDFIFLHFFMQRGHSLRELISLNPDERFIMEISMELELELQVKLMEGGGTK